MCIVYMLYFDQCSNLQTKIYHNNDTTNVETDKDPLIEYIDEDPPNIKTSITSNEFLGETIFNSKLL